MPTIKECMPLGENLWEKKKENKEKENQTYKSKVKSETKIQEVGAMEG